MNTYKNTYKNPSWWNDDTDSAWDHVKDAFKRDWDQTKHDFGGKEPDTRQNVSDTVKQATGTQVAPPRGEPVYEKAEMAFRYGYGARAHYGRKHPTWNPDLETQLRQDWHAANPGDERFWDENGEFVRSGWDYEE